MTEKFLRKHAVRGHDAILMSDYKRCPFAMLICQSGDNVPIAVVLAERNRMARFSKSTSHFLCLRDGERHVNYGASNDWVDEEKFEMAALEIVDSWLAGRHER